MPPRQVTEDNNKFSFVSMRISIAGRTFTEINGMAYNDTINRSFVYGTSPYPLGWSIRGLLVASHKRWKSEGKGMWPDEFCAAENWYPRLHKAICDGYAKHQKEISKDSDPMSREEFFLKYLNTLKE